MPSRHERTIRQRSEQSPRQAQTEIGDSDRGKLLMAALRQNISLLQELATRYEVGATSIRRDVDAPSVRHHLDAAALLRPEMEDLVQEQLRVLLLDAKNRVMGRHLIYQGNVSSAVVRPAEVFREALMANAPKVLVAHNHPSGDPEPSPEDVSITAQLLRAGQLLGISVVDHLVIGRDTVVSLRARGLPQSARWLD